MTPDLINFLEDGERVQFRNGEYGRYVPWGDTHYDPGTLVFELETPGRGLKTPLSLIRAVNNWQSTYRNGLQDIDGKQQNEWDIVSQHGIYTEYPW